MECSVDGVRLTGVWNVDYSLVVEASVADTAFITTVAVIEATAVHWVSTEEGLWGRRWLGVSVWGRLGLWDWCRLGVRVRSRGRCWLSVGVRGRARLWTRGGVGAWGPKNRRTGYQQA